MSEVEIKHIHCDSAEELFEVLEGMFGEDDARKLAHDVERYAGVREMTLGCPRMEEEKEEGFLEFEDVRVPFDMDLADLSDEESRTYHYDDGDLLIRHPVALRISDSGSHYVVTGHGHTIYVPQGWRYLSWIAREGENHISF